MSKWLTGKIGKYHDFAVSWKAKSDTMISTHPGMALVYMGVAKQFEELEDAMSIIKLL